MRAKSQSQLAFSACVTATTRGKGYSSRQTRAGRLSGARTNNELCLYRDFQAAGLPPPTLRNELLLGDTPEIRAI